MTICKTVYVKAIKYAKGWGQKRYNKGAYEILRPPEKVAPPLQYFAPPEKI